MTRLLAVAVLTAAVEAYLVARYAEFGALFHYWLHGLYGVAAGLVVTAVVAALRRRRQRAGGAALIAAALLGHLFFAAPDIVFLALDTPHAGWMDVFGAHITVHFVPLPVLSAFVAFALAVCAGAAAALRRRAAALATAGGVAVLFAVGLLLARPLPATLEDVRDHPGIALDDVRDHPGIALDDVRDRASTALNCVLPTAAPDGYIAASQG